MKRALRKICAVLYYTIGRHLHPSYTYYMIFGRQVHISYGMYIRGILASQMLAKAGKNINIEKGASFSRNVTLGHNSGIGYKCEVAPGTTIGDNVMMGPEVIIFNVNHSFSRTDIPMCQQGFQKEKNVTIGNDVWIGRRVMILPGVTIGDGCIIGAGAVVSRDIEPYSIAVGNPATVVKKRVNSDSSSKILVQVQ